MASLCSPLDFSLLSEMESGFSMLIIYLDTKTFIFSKRALIFGRLARRYVIFWFENSVFEINFEQETFCQNLA